MARLKNDQDQETVKKMAIPIYFDPFKHDLLIRPALSGHATEFRQPFVLSMSKHEWLSRALRQAQGERW